jgi:hypothetical protein
MREDAAGNPSIEEDKYLKTAEEFFGLARTATNSFMRAYYEAVALRYLSSQGELKRSSEVASRGAPDRH